jgi:hypothetical protein
MLYFDVMERVLALFVRIGIGLEGASINIFATALTSDACGYL